MGEVSKGVVILAVPISDGADLSSNGETPVGYGSRDGDLTPGIPFEFKKPLPVGPRKGKLTCARLKNSEHASGQKWEKGKTRMSAKPDANCGRKVKHGRPKLSKSKPSDASRGRKLKKLMAKMKRTTSSFDGIFKFEAGCFFAHELWCGDINFVREWVKTLNLPGRRKYVASKNKQLCVAARELGLMGQRIRMTCPEARRDANSIHVNFPISVPYKEPRWSGLPTSAYALEVLRSKKCTKEIDLSNKSCHVIGRCPNCDIVTVNPTVSSLHCVLQFRINGDDENPPGYYICDLGSKYGTYLNKTRLKPNIFVRVQVGDLIKLGLSNTKYLLQGPTYEEEDELKFAFKEIEVSKNALQSGGDILRENIEEQGREMKGEVGIDWDYPWDFPGDI